MQEFLRGELRELYQCVKDLRRRLVGLKVPDDFILRSQDERDLLLKEMKQLLG